MGLKKQRMDGILLREISDIIQFSIKDPNIGFVTVTDVDVTGDLSIARVYITTLGKSGNTEKALEALQHAKGHIRSELSKRLSIRKCPDIQFKADTSLEHGNHIAQVLKELKETE
ncbi:MAG: 30S ribosome-binding factor RbfA [Erysipelotrichaceae bacterium]|nr:30S ribosome-binding factor RbfA [Erysipelotrichaceae bacterium]